jgi:hypothetical protein
MLVCSLPRQAGACRLLSYTFEPECFGGAPCGFDVGHPDFGAQIAVWVESADGTRFVDTLMVTNAVGIHGIGNRPGSWDLRSGPRFPYGRRQMALPIWAHARGELYDLVVMEGGRDDEVTTHEEESSPEPYFCRPMMVSEEVDAVTCPSGRFRSCKGVLDASMPRSYYPPRADLYDFGSMPCMILPQYLGSCDPGDSAQYAFLNDVDTVAAATPAYGAPTTNTWVVPTDLPDGDYALLVEVGKEFDTDAANQHPSFISADETVYYGAYGQDGNIGAPSVLYRVPFSLGDMAAASATTDIAGYGDWSGAAGDVNAPDGSIGTAPGSGAGRLKIIDGPTGPGRVHVETTGCPAFDCTAMPGPEPVAFTVSAEASGTTARLHVHQSNEAGQPVVGYELRASLIASGEAALDPSTFSDWTPAGTIPVGPPDSEADLTIGGLTPLSYYAIGIRARGVCGDSVLTFQRFLTPAAPFVKLSGCFVATAAFGSALGPEVARLRRLRDAAGERSALARAAIDLYYRAAPPLAALIARSPLARAAARELLRKILL